MLLGILPHAHFGDVVKILNVFLCLRLAGKIILAITRSDFVPTKVPSQKSKDVVVHPIRCGGHVERNLDDLVEV